MKMFSIRLVLVLALALIVIVATLSAGITALILTNGTTTAQQDSTMVQAMLTDSTKWTNPGWQRATQARLNALNMNLVLRDPAGQTIYKSDGYSSLAPSFQQIVITDGTHQIGSAFLYECTPTIVLTLQMLLIGLILLLLTISGVVVCIAMTILKPLSTLSRAAHQVANQNLDFQFPVSHVREIAEVFQSFARMSEALRISLQREAEIEQERRLFISAIAHDLRTPLFSLRGYLEGLATGLAGTPEKTARYIEVCQIKAAALERLIADLFTYTQLEYLEQPPRQEQVEIGALIRHTIESLEPQALAKGVKLIPRGPAKPAFLRADPDQLIRVFENLLDNALRYTPTKGSIRVNWYFARDRLVFTVADTGPGIAANDLPHLFTPLYRGDPSRNSRTGGAGLGLAIAQRILHAHGGNLTAVNARGGGAVFSGSLAYG